MIQPWNDALIFWKKKLKSEDCIEINDSLSNLTEDQISAIKRLVTNCVDTGIHDFLYSIEVVQDELSVSVNGEEIVMHISEHSDQSFRDYPITHFGLNRSLIPRLSDHF